MHRIMKTAALGLLCVILCGCNDQTSDRLGKGGRIKFDPLSARAGFTTKLIPSAYQADGPAPAPPPEIFQTVRYVSPAGSLVAYISPDPGDGKKHPAVIWAHGGFGGIGDYLWKKDDMQDPGAFREAGLIVMCPSWRGENDNPGKFELFYGELDDAVAAVDYLASVPYVDPNRIYIAGHSTGGTMTLLTAETSKKLRAAFSFGGAPDIRNVVGDGKGYGNTPFDYQNADECSMRSPIYFAAAIKCPTFYFEGEKSAYPPDALKMEEITKELKIPFKPFIVQGGTHFDILQPLCRMVAQKIVEDTGPTCAISITESEVRQAYTAGR
jgi:dienelactone hydrolase